MVRRGDRAGYLIDTHVLIWALENSPKLSQAHRAVLSLGDGLFVSPVVLWEIEAKVAKGKLRLTGDIDALLNEAGCIELAVTWQHARQLRNLPQLHRDPFDRMLIAQAEVERLILLTDDRFIRQYPVDFI